jgi:hypothetical protein
MTEEETKEKKSPMIFNKLIGCICLSIVGYTGVSFLSCNFMIPGSINSASSLGILKNPPQLDCKESERKGYETLLALLTTVIALKTNLKE